MVSLDKLIETLNDNPTITIELMAHTDARDSEEFNLNLSQQRAQSVVDYLIERGVDPVRVTARGYGESLPKTVNKRIADSYTFLNEDDILDEAFIDRLPITQQEEAHQLNRRTEFRVLRTDYQPAE
jgi:peptidoglycan-associated lipoprotein